MIIVDDGDSGPVAIGPVPDDDDIIEDLRGLAEENGWENLGTARVVSIAAFKAACRAGRKP